MNVQLQRKKEGSMKDIGNKKEGESQQSKVCMDHLLSVSHSELDLFQLHVYNTSLIGMYGCGGSSLMPRPPLRFCHIAVEKLLHNYETKPGRIPGNETWRRGGSNLLVSFQGVYPIFCNMEKQEDLVYTQLGISFVVRD